MPLPLPRFALGILLSGCATSGAQIFSEDFDDVTAPAANFNGAPAGQVTTTHDLVFGASLSGWSGVGAGTIHAVDTANTWPGPTANPQNWGVMIWQDNVMTQTAGIAGSNEGGVDYRIDFLAGGAVYENAGQVNNGTTDNLLIEVLRASDSTVLHSFNHTPAAPVGVGNLGLVPVNFNYTGDGSGDILFRIGPGNADQGRFQGTIDDLELSVIPESDIDITSFTATPESLADAGEAVTFDWTVTGTPLDSLVITPGDIDVLANTDETGLGSATLDPGPNGTIEYTLTAMKEGDTVSSKVTVTLPAPGITSFTASSNSIAPGEEITLSWQVDLPATTLTINPGNIDVLGDTAGSGAGSIMVNPAESKTYTLSASRGTSTSNADTTVIVVTPPNPDALIFESFEGITAPPENFNGAPAGQVTTTHDLVFGAGLDGWSASGGGAIHAVDIHNIWTDGAVSNNPPNWAVMIWQDNVLTQDDGIANSNESGVEYRIDFLAAGAVYEQAAQVNDGTTDAIQIEVLRASDEAVLHTFTQVVAPPIDVNHLGLTPYNFNYTGDGSGYIKFRIGPANPDQGRFQGTIDDLQLSPAGPGFQLEITAIQRDSLTKEVTITFNSVDEVIYEIWGSTDLQNWQVLDNSVMGAGTSTQFTDSVFAPANPGRAFYQVRKP